MLVREGSTCLNRGSPSPMFNIKTKQSSISRNDTNPGSLGAKTRDTLNVVVVLRFDLSHGLNLLGGFWVGKLHTARSGGISGGRIQEANISIVVLFLHPPKSRNHEEP